MASRSRAAAGSWRRSTSAVTLAIGLLAAAPGAERRSLPDRVRDYVDRFERDASALVAEEHYIQRLELRSGPSRTHWTRELRSDYVLVKPADTSPWLGYRDIFEVDGTPVREREARVVALLAGTAPDSLARAAAFARDGSRFNLGPERTINTPTMALQLMARLNADRLRVRVPRNWEHQDTASIAFEERDRPTIVRTPDGHNVESSGTVAVRVADGAILSAQLHFRFTAERRRRDARMQITYGPVGGVSVLVPVRLSEQLPTSEGEASGVATYSKYRRFQTSARIR